MREQPPAPDPAAPATQTPDADLHRALSIARGNGRGSRMTLVVMVLVFTLQILGGLQTRHGWPILLIDAAYAIAVGIALGAWYRIYHGQG